MCNADVLIWVPDALIVRDIDNITRVIARLIETDTFTDIFQRLGHK
ncbi:hypothetical protein [Streptomyces sp. NPDC095817]